VYDLLASEPRIYLLIGLAWVICPAALLWGGGPERAVAATWLVVFELAGRIIPEFFGIKVQAVSVDMWLLTGDFVAGFILIAVALYANRNYTLLIAAMQVLAMTAHVARGLVESIAPVAYIIMLAAPGWIQLLLLALGLGRHIQRKRQFGPYRDWRTVRTGANLEFVAEGPQPGVNQLRADQAAGKQPSWRDELK